MAPYYNKPSQEGLYRHFRAIAEAVKIPIVLYVFPGRCGIEIGVETVVRLAGTIAPALFASRKPGAPWNGSASLGKRFPETFEILSGDDSLTLPFLSAGGVGVISVASNLIPREVSDFSHAPGGRAGPGGCRCPSALLSRFSRICSLSRIPFRIKYALFLKGVMSAEVRLPLCEMSDANKEKLRSTPLRVETPMKKLNAPAAAWERLKRRTLS